MLWVLNEIVFGLRDKKNKFCFNFTVLKPGSNTVKKKTVIKTSKIPQSQPGGRDTKHRQSHYRKNTIKVK